MYTLFPFARHAVNVNDVFNQFDRYFVPSETAMKAAFHTDVKDEGDHFLLEADLPGFQKEDINVEVKEGVLTITAEHSETKEPSEPKENKDNYIFRERRWGSFSRSFEVSEIEAENIAAAYDNGVLKLTLPKRAELVPQTHKIAIG